MRSYLIAQLILPLMLIILLSGIASAKLTDHGHGIVDIKGSIIDTPCSIEVNDQNQAIEFGSITTGELIQNGHGPESSFAIHLINCVLEPSHPWEHGWSEFQVTFEGEHDDGLFGIIGASGIGVRIRDPQGNIALPGVPLPRSRLTLGNHTLNYSLQLLGDHHQLQAGDYRAAIRFKVDYF